MSPFARCYGYWTVKEVVLTLALVGFAAIGSNADPAKTQTALGRAVGSGTYWCPMHPNIRGEKGDVCRICHMPLVLAPPPDYAPYHVAIETSPRGPGVGTPTHIRLIVNDPRTNELVKNFETVHERLLHLFILSQDLTYFAHVHPALQSDGSFVYEEVFPNPGAYRLIADFLPVNGSPQFVQQTVVTSGYRGSLLPSARLTPDLADKIIDGVRIRLSMPSPVGGRAQLLTFEFLDASTGQPISDLEPYLGAVGHLLLVSADLQDAAHSHPVADMSAAVGPTVVFQALFPRATVYRFWIQVQRHGRVIAAPFTVAVRPREPVRD